MNALEHLGDGRDNAKDRQLGSAWEGHFCELAARYGKSFTPQQLGRHVSATWYRATATGTNPTLLPDVTIWTAPGEHHEIKHKNPMGDSYGLEAYRLKALWEFQRVTEQRVFYTIHDWELAGAPESRAPMPNDIAHWRTVSIVDLVAFIKKEKPAPVSFRTYVNGRMDLRRGYWWPTALWQPLEKLWDRLPF